MSAPTPLPAAVSHKRTRPDPVALLWSEAALLEQSVWSDVRTTARVNDPTTARRRKALVTLGSVNGTKGWASRDAIAVAMDEMEEALKHERQGTCNDALVRMGTIRLLLDAQDEVVESKKAREPPAAAAARVQRRPVAYLIHIHLDADDREDEVWVVQVDDLPALKAAHSACFGRLDRAAGALLPALSQWRVERLSSEVSTATTDDAEQVVWRIPIYHAHKEYTDGSAPLKCMLCEH